jgi:hypothetical protein
MTSRIYNSNIVESVVKHYNPNHTPQRTLFFHLEKKIVLLNEIYIDSSFTTGVDYCISPVKIVKLSTTKQKQKTKQKLKV